MGDLAVYYPKRWGGRINGTTMEGGIEWDEFADRRKVVKGEMMGTGEKMDLDVGQGRGALVKALSMAEGDGIRDAVVRVTDKTPIRVGGVRLQKRRRL